MATLKIPTYETDFLVSFGNGPDGAEIKKMNPLWWRFLASMAAQITGIDPSVTPVNAAGILGVVEGVPDAFVARSDNADIALGVAGSIAVGRNDGAGDLVAQAMERIPDQIRGDGAYDLALQALQLVSAMSITRSGSQQIVVYTQAQYAVAYAAGLGTDALFVFVSDYVHMIYWDGSAANFAGDQSGCISLWESDPGTGYHLCDGSTVNRLNADGTITGVTLQDLTSVGALAAFLEAGGANSGPTAATAPGFSGASATGNAAFNPANTVGGTANISGNTGNDSGTQIVAAGAGATVPAEPHTHSAGTIADSGHIHAYTPTDTGHAHGKGTFAVDSTGEPRKLVRRPFYRQ